MKTVIEPPKFAALDDAARKHQVVLLNAMHCAHPVLLAGRERFIHVMHARQAGGRIEMDVWLTGSPEPVSPELLSLPTIKQ